MIFKDKYSKTKPHRMMMIFKDKWNRYAERQTSSEALSISALLQ